MARRMFAALVMALGWVTSGAAADSPSEIIGELNAVLLEVMGDAESLGFDGRYERLAPLFSRVFHFPLMARVAVGRHWEGLSATERGRLIDSFGRMSVATFASRFDGYSGERFEVLGERPAPRDSILVENRLVKATGESVAINYLLRDFDGEWRVIDIYLDAKYSELAMKRSEYTSVIGRRGFDDLIRLLDDKIAELETDASE